MAGDAGGGAGQQPLPGSSFDDGVEPDPDSVARTICLRLLTATPKTRAELADALRRRDVPGEVAARVLDRLTEVGLLDDAAFARSWVDTRHTGRGLARRALAHELRRRGVEEATVDDAVQALDPDQEKATAQALVRRKLPSTRRLDPQARRRRLAGLLARKGYSSGLALQVVREELAAEGDDPDEHDILFGADD